MSKVLIVDDDQAVARFVASVVEKAGLESSSVHSAAEAVKLLEQERFSLAIIDMRLPDGTGLDLAARIKGVDPGASVVIMTGFPGGRNVSKSLGAAVDGYLVKPVNPTILLTLLRQLVADSPEGAGDEKGS